MLACASGVVDELRLGAEVRPRVARQLRLLGMVKEHNQHCRCRAAELANHMGRGSVEAGGLDLSQQALGGVASSGHVAYHRVPVGQEARMQRDLRHERARMAPLGLLMMRRCHPVGVRP